MKRAVVGIARHPKETDFLSPYSARRNRGFTALLLSGSLLVAPLLLTRQGESTADQAVTSRPAASGLAVAARLLNDEMYVPPAKPVEPPRVVIASSTRAASRATQVVARTPVTTAPKPKPKVTAKPKPKPTATAAAASPPSPAPEPQGNAQQGGASWYDAPAGTCAHKTLPMGTVITVTAVSSGKQITCNVADRGPYIKGRVIDLSRERFTALADTSAGVIQVRIEW